MKFIKNSLSFWSKNFPFKNNKSHKYSRGQLIVVSGENQMVGASMLSAEAALRTGVGSVKILCSKKNFKLFTLKFPSMLKKEVNSLNEFKSFVNKNKNSVYLIGPGAGVSQITMQKTSYLLKNIKYVILDADALTSFKKKTNQNLKQKTNGILGNEMSFKQVLLSFLFFLIDPLLFVKTGFFNT